MRYTIINTIILTGFILIFSFCQTRKTTEKKLPEFVVETEEIVYEYLNPDNGSHPFWCHGSSIMARNKEDIYLSGIETLPQFQPLNNIRWKLFKRDSNGWVVKQADERGRQREPCPIGLFSDGRLMMSVNPNFETDPSKPSRINTPQVLEFNTVDLSTPYKTHIPEWNGNPVFAPHTYRTFSVDRENNEFIIFQNVGYTHSEWAFRDRNGKWFAGQLKWKERIDDPIPPYGENYMRVNYPSVVLRNRELHFCGNTASNIWSRIKNMDDAVKIGLPDIVNAGGGRIAGGRFRYLQYTWTPDITKVSLSPFLVIDSSLENGENLRTLDMWRDPQGTIHLIWHKNPINQEIRDKFFPDIKRIWSINYAQIRDGKLLLKKALIETGDGVSRTPENDLMDKYAINWGRFQVLPDNRLFVIFHISGTDKENIQKSENRIFELFPDGTTSRSVPLALNNPMSFFFTATPRGGSLPSSIIDLVGRSESDRTKVRYARINIQEK